MAASGAVVIASSSGKSSDLYWALRGSGNDFGIVVNFNLCTIPVSPGGAMWGGTRTFLETSFPGVIKAFAKTVAD